MAEDVIKAKIVFDTSGLGAVAGGMGAPAGGGGAGGLAGVGNIAKGVAAGMIGATAVLTGMKKLFEKTVASSPRLQATMGIISKSITLFLRPIAMIMDVFLRPMAIMLLRLSIKLLRAFQDGTVLEDTKKAVGEISAEGRRGAEIGGAIGGGPGAFIGGIITGGAELLEKSFNFVVEAAKNLALSTINWIDMLAFNVFGIDLTPVTDAVYSFIENNATWIQTLTTNLMELPGILLNTIKNVITDGFQLDDFNELALWFLEFTQNLFESSMYILLTLGEWTFILLKEIFVGTFEILWAIGKWKWDLLTKIFTGSYAILKDIGSWTWDLLKSIFNKSFDVLSGIGSWIFSKIKSFFNIFKKDKEEEKEEGRQHGGVISPGQSYMVGEAGPELITPSRSGFVSPAGSFGGGSKTVNVTVNALDASSIDTAVINKIVRAVEEAMQRGLSGRTTESIGI